MNEQQDIIIYRTTNGRASVTLYAKDGKISQRGYRVRGVRSTQFRQWATEHLTEYLVKGEYLAADAEDIKILEEIEKNILAKGKQ